MMLEEVDEFKRHKYVARSRSVEGASGQALRGRKSGSGPVGVFFFCFQETRD